MSNFFRKAGVILEESPAWEIEQRGIATDGKGDCIFRTAHFAMTRDDLGLFLSCADLLLFRRRWPKELDDPRGRKYEHRKIQGLGSMTRDPYIMFYSACVMLKNIWWIEQIRPPWYIWRPHLTAWRRYLITGSQKHKRRYEFWMKLSLSLFTPPAYAIYLDAWMAWIADSEKVQEHLRSLAPSWNYMLYQLTLHPLRYLQNGLIAAYLPREGFIWQSPVWLSDKDYLMEDDEYKMDRDILLYVYEKNQSHDREDN